MKVLSILFSALLVFCSFGPKSEVQNIKYQVLLDGRAIGVYDVNRTDVNDSRNYRIVTNTAAGLIRKSEHRFTMLSSFKDSKMISSSLKTWVNQKLETSSDIKWDGDQYVRKEGDDLTEICSELVTYSSACVYFEEPINRNTMFSEKYGQDLEVVKLEDHKYEVKLPNGGVERYTYLNGMVSKVELVKSFVTITLEATS